MACETVILIMTVTTISFNNFADDRKSPQYDDFLLLLSLIHI